MGQDPLTDQDHPDDFRYDLAQEELNEYTAAESKKQILDSLCDQQYVLFGTVLAHGLGGIFWDAFCEIHWSNMTKSPNPDGGKAIKGEDYEPPILEVFI